MQEIMGREGWTASQDEIDAKGPVAMFINQGLKLEAQQYKLRTLVKASGTAPEDIMKKRETLRSHIQAWRKLQLLHMLGIENILASVQFKDPEN
ncbi:hypothetical protein AAF712_016687 [Marasmius tenuissimus]|uniref:Uncharacterized protein n=1 Tax=Marasmius tenuissimus TaxID=585030 RepID=A0ABR2Z629_9AGAR